MYLVLAFLAFINCSQSEPSFSNPVSQLATKNQFEEEEFEFWRNELHEPKRYHRKVWEFCYVAQILNKYGYLKPGMNGLGFAVGQEPLPALFAKYGCQILATDQDFKAAIKQGWSQSNQHLGAKKYLNSKNICPEEIFNNNVNIGVLDMNDLGSPVENFDFVWSCCSFEHLGSIDLGLNFFINSMKFLKKGGIAVHTTEFNISSNTNTISEGATVLFRKQDIERLLTKIESLGYIVLDINFNPGNESLDKHIDLPPYSHDNHIKLKLFDKYDCTSIGIVAFKQ